MNKLTNTNKPFDLVQTESLWDSCFTLLRPWLTFFFPCMTGGMGLEIWLTARIRNYLSRYVVGGSRHVGGIGLMLAAISWTDRADWHGVFVSGSSERESVGLQQLLQPNPALLFSQGLRGTCEGCQLSIVCSAGTGRQKERVWFFFFFAARFTSVVSLFFLFLNEGWQLFFSHSFSPLIPFLLCSASFFATSFEGWEGKEGRSKRTRTLCPPISLGYLWWHY